MSEDTFQRWFSRSRLLEVFMRRAVLGVPNAIYQVWIEMNHLGQLQAALQAATGRLMDVEFRCLPEFELADGEEGAVVAAGLPATEKGKVTGAFCKPWSAAGKSPSEPAPAGVVQEPWEKAEEAAERRKLRKAVTEAGLNPELSFRNFVRGENSAFAVAAGLAVAEKPARIYNPLFIYGKTGLGKTHLMQSIGQAIIARGKRKRVRYVTAEWFINGFIEAVREGTLPSFRKTYRELDVLLIDDVQLLAGKERSQEEFFHTFNHLVNSTCQVVLTSDCAPADIPTLEERLVSRFQWGLTAMLDVPDVETRSAILRKKMETNQVSIGDEILDFIAQNIRTNVRRLEGALMTVASHASLKDERPLTLERVEDLLKGILAEERTGPVSISKIQEVVAKKWDIRLSDMTSKRRPQCIAYPRQIAMYLSRRLTELSYEVIGDAFGGRDHGTVMHAYRKIVEVARKDDEFRRMIQKLEEEIKSGGG